MITQMRRYELVPEQQEHFIAWWNEHIPSKRAPFGFRVLSAHLDPIKHEFTWIVEHDGDATEFAAAEAAWFGSPERAAIFAGQPVHTVAIHVSLVNKIY
jgi:hypothetical protein